MGKRWLYVAVLVLGTGSMALAAPPGDAKVGKTVFTQSCQGCHGANGEGNPAIAKMMNVKMRPLGSKEVQAQSDAVLRKDITDGVGKMPPQKSLSAKQVDDVIAYIRELGK
jgi:mono/diheme cytochrome c family protein